MESLKERVSQVAVSKAIHYAYPLSTITYFILSLILSCCMQQNGTFKTTSRTPNTDRLTTWLMLSALLTYVVEAAMLILRIVNQPHGCFATRDQKIYVMSAILVWAVINLGFLDSTPSVRYPYIGVWVIGGACEITLTLLNTSSWRAHDSFDVVGVALHAVRVLIFALLMSTTRPFSCCSKESPPTQGESRPLLGKDQDQTRCGITAKLHVEDAKQCNDDEKGSGSLAQDDASTKQQREGLEKSGSSWTYIKAFSIVLPYVWPSEDRWLQLVLVIKILCVLAQRALNLLIPRQLGIITDALAAEHPSAPWKAIALWMLLYYLESSAGLYVLKRLSDLLLEHYSIRKIKNAAFAKLMSLSMDFHSNKDAAEVIQAIHQGESLGNLRDLIMFDLAPIGLDIVIGVGYFYYVFDAYVGIIAVAVIIAYIWVGIKANKYETAAAKKYNEKSREERKIMHEGVDEWQTVSYFNRVEHEKTRLATVIDEALSYNWRSEISYTIGSGIKSLIKTLGFLGISFLVVYRISIGLQPVGTFVTMSSYWAVLLKPLHMIAYSHSHISWLLVDAERLLQLLQTNPSVTDKQSAVPLKMSSGRVEFDHVSFFYDPRKPTLTDISFVAEGGKTIALVGKTGAGKSTIFKLLCRFYDVKDGHVRIDGQDLRDITLESLREVLGVVPQNPSLFNISIMENVRYARLNATDREVHEACKAAAIHDKILSFPDGYQSTVGQRGVKLSGGELQRVAIARALLKNSRIVLLDEATSAVDTETEEQIQDAFKKLSEGRTTFVIAHRLSTIAKADVILVIDDGQVIERGSHDELLKARVKYYSLWSKQMNKASDVEASPTLINEITQDDFRAS